ncbi:nonstructural protein [Blackfly microvirus SF02]|uniref:Nonstructural protein n=1 Tax=Blackfly microvirus SF02 TaxID=2576452 RepID=A0A4P8PK32_9VIRU|nr:nonstructural protein [Blackfly microvirus SF02]
MILEVYTIYDKAVKAYMQPFYVRARGEALRSFTEAVNDPAKPFGKYAVDYLLVALGSFDDSSGVFSSGEPVRVVGAEEVLVTPDPV